MRSRRSFLIGELESRGICFNGPLADELKYEKVRLGEEVLERLGKRLPATMEAFRAGILGAPGLQSRQKLAYRAGAAPSFIVKAVGAIQPGFKIHDDLLEAAASFHIAAIVIDLITDVLHGGDDLSSHLPPDKLAHMVTAPTLYAAPSPQCPRDIVVILLIHCFGLLQRHGLADDDRVARNVRGCPIGDPDDFQVPAKRRSIMRLMQSWIST